MTRRFRHYKENRGGAVSVTIVLLIVVLIVIAGLVAAVYIWGQGDGKDDPYQGGDPSHPIIGYWQLTATIKHDNEAFKPYTQNIDSVTATMVSKAPGQSFMQMFNNLFEISQHNDKWIVEFRVTNTVLQYDTGWYDVSYYLQIGGWSTIYKAVSPLGQLAIRDHGTYQVTVMLLDSGGNSVDSMTQYATV